DDHVLQVVGRVVLRVGEAEVAGLDDATGALDRGNRSVGAGRSVVGGCTDRDRLERDRIGGGTGIRAAVGVLDLEGEGRLAGAGRGRVLELAEAGDRNHRVVADGRAVERQARRAGHDDYVLELARRDIVRIAVAEVRRAERVG